MVRFNEESIHIADIKAIIEEAEDVILELTMDIEELQDEIEDTQLALETYVRENDEEGERLAKVEIRDLTEQVISKQRLRNSKNDETYRMAKKLQLTFGEYREWAYNGYLINKNHFVQFIKNYIHDSYSIPKVIDMNVDWARVAECESSAYVECRISTGQTYYIMRG